MLNCLQGRRCWRREQIARLRRGTIPGEKRIFVMAITFRRAERG
jgi:hypothetical protein